MYFVCEIFIQLKTNTNSYVIKEVSLQKVIGYSSKLLKETP